MVRIELYEFEPTEKITCAITSGGFVLPIFLVNIEPGQGLDCSTVPKGVV